MYPQSSRRVSEADPGREASLIQELYLDRATPGLAAWVENFGIDAEGLTRSIGRRPDFFGSLRDLDRPRHRVDRRSGHHRSGPSWGRRRFRLRLTGRHALVTDFGVAKAVTEAAGTHDLTLTGVALGTPAYMAPEQAAADPVDHRVDIYAFGVLAYELLTGEQPFEGSIAQAVLSAHLTDDPHALRPSARPSRPSWMLWS